MARTALVDLLRRAAAISAVARSSGEPLDEAIDRDIAMRTDASRRRFLLQSITASTALTLGACASTRLMRKYNADDVIVVGAGVAGLTAAWRLRQAGVGVKLYEAQERVGGRMLSLRNHFADGQVCELGGELIDTGHARIRALAAELDLPLDDLSEDPTHSFGDIWFYDGRRYSEAEILRAFAPLAEAIQRDADSSPNERLGYPQSGFDSKRQSRHCARRLRKMGAYLARHSQLLPVPVPVLHSAPTRPAGSTPYHPGCSCRRQSLRSTQSIPSTTCTLKSARKPIHANMFSRVWPTRSMNRSPFPGQSPAGARATSTRGCWGPSRSKLITARGTSPQHNTE